MRKIDYAFLLLMAACLVVFVIIHDNNARAMIFADDVSANILFVRSRLAFVGVLVTFLLVLALLILKYIKKNAVVAELTERVETLRGKLDDFQDQLEKDYCHLLWTLSKIFEDMSHVRSCAGRYVILIVRNAAASASAIDHRGFARSPDAYNIFLVVLRQVLRNEFEQRSCERLAFIRECQNLARIVLDSREYDVILEEEAKELAERASNKKPK